MDSILLLHISTIYLCAYIMTTLNNFPFNKVTTLFFGLGNIFRVETA